MEFKRLQNIQSGAIKYFVNGKRVAPHMYHNAEDECQCKGMKYCNSLTTSTKTNYKHSHSYN